MEDEEIDMEDIEAMEEMEDLEDIGDLIPAFANYYRSVPVSFVRNTILDWYPDITAKQFDSVLESVAGEPPDADIVVVTRNVKEPQLVKWSFFAEDDSSYARFLKHRKDLPFAIRSEEEILDGDNDDGIRYDISETQALYYFAHKELGLDCEEAWDMVSDTMSSQERALWFNESWVIDFIKSSAFKGTLRFKSPEQFRRFRDLGNNMYRNLPNPYLRGWKPAEFENPPALPDDFPKTKADMIRIMREVLGKLEIYNGGEKIDTSQMSDETFYRLLGDLNRIPNLTARFK